MSKELINNRFISVINFLIEQRYATTKLSISEQLGISSSKFSEILGRRMNVSAELIGCLVKCYPQISLDWLMLGEGEMVVPPADVQPTTVNTQPVVDYRERMLPLLPISAVAGWNGWDVAGVDFVDCEKILVSDFIGVGAEFAIRVSGNSMLPTISNGDILACRKVREASFIQWGKIYVIDSSEGPMVKRVFPVNDNNELIHCISDNEAYPPFNLPKSEVRTLSLVVGIIKME